MRYLYAMSIQKEQKRITTNTILEMKQNGEKIAMLTAYDYSMAKMLDEAGVDVLLVGDSASNVMAGHETTLPITLDQMIYHAQSVVRAAKRSLVVVDLPFGSYPVCLIIFPVLSFTVTFFTFPFNPSCFKRYLIDTGFSASNGGVFSFPSATKFLTIPGSLLS